MSLGDPVEPYGYGSGLGEDADRIDELASQLSELLDEVDGRIDATEGVRRPIRDRGDDFEIPDSDYPDLSDVQGTVSSAVSGWQSVRDVLDVLTDEMRAAASNLAGPTEDAARTYAEAAAGDADALESSSDIYPSWDVVPDVLLEIEYPPLSFADKVDREPRTRQECPGCGRHFRVASSGSPKCQDCREGKAPRPLPTVNVTIDQKVSALGERC